MSKNKNYIDKAEMHQEIIKSHEHGRCSEKLGKMFMILCEKYSHDYKFREYERRYGRAFKEDLLSAGYFACVRAWNKFDYEKFDNPFSYFTTCIFRAYIGYLTKEYGWINTKNAAKVEAGLRGDYGYEEMIKEQEAIVDDEENSEFSYTQDDSEEEGEDVDVEENFQIKSEDDATEAKDPEKDYVVTNPAVESMSLWDEPTDKVVDSIPKFTTLFGIKEGRKT